MIYLWLVSYFKRLFSQYMPVTTERQVCGLKSFLDGELDLCVVRIYLCQLHLVLKMHRLMDDSEELVRCEYVVCEGWDEQHYPHKVIGWHDVHKYSFVIPIWILFMAVDSAEV